MQTRLDKIFALTLCVTIFIGSGTLWARQSAEFIDQPFYVAENAGKPGYYTVKPGDTLFRIALENGQDWKDLARWNNIDNSNPMKVGQILRVIPPGATVPDAQIASGTGVAKQAGGSENLEEPDTCKAPAGCSAAVNKAPVEDRATDVSGDARSAQTGDRPLHGTENAVKPGYYTVKPGDTLIRIALENDHDWKDLARWNNIDNSKPIEVGQVLRVIPPGAATSSTRATSNTGVATRPDESRNLNSVKKPRACDRNLMHLASRLPNYTHPTLANVRNAVLTSPLQKQSAQSALQDAANAEQSAAAAARTANSTDGRSGLTNVQRVDNGTLPLSWPCEGIHANAICAYIIHKWEALAYREIAAMATSCP